MSQPMNPYDPPEYSRPGMSGTAKVLLGMGIGCGLLVLLCCGFFGAGSWWIVRTAQQALTRDPEAVRRLTAEIVDVDIPPSLPPAIAMDFIAPIVGTRLMIWAIYGDPDQADGLILVQFGSAIADEQNMHFQWRESVGRNSRGDWEDIEVQQSEKHEVTIGGEPATFTVAKGLDKKGEEVIQARGAFRGAGGPAMLLLKVKAAELSQEQVLAIIDSMK